MTGRTSGLERDVEIVRRRAWLFLPFLVLGILVALVLSQRGSGVTSGRATIQLQTSIHTLAPGGDQGFKVYDAQAMTRLPQFREEVIDKIGDKNFDYARFAIILNPNVAPEGASSGNLVATISAGTRADVEKYIQAFIDVFNKEFTSTDGLFRTQFIEQQTDVATAADKQYADATTKLQQMAQQAGISVPVSQLGNANQTGGYASQLAQNQADLATQEAETQAALDSITGVDAGTAGAIASAVLGQPVSGADAVAALQARVTSLQSALKAIDAQAAAASGLSLPADIRAQADEVRALGDARTIAATDVANARSSLASGFTSADPSTVITGGSNTSVLALLAIVIGVTVVFGLVAIYLLEWFFQVRSGDAGEA